ncbi:MAG: alpha-glucan family phosphorylase, partial [Deltaproteobacteria bacterium]|nr:alpha-glucan family phosphorylase [Deltaproteobacteria bacterium]
MKETESFLHIPALQVADIWLPDEVERLHDVAYNLWWSWNHPALRLFGSIESRSWLMYRNPVEILLNIDRQQWEGLLASDAFMERYAAVTDDLDSYLNPQRETWFERHFADFEGGPVAYFSMEFGLHQSLPIYSGGLGVLSGDHCKAASDLGLPFIGVGLLYRYGYFKQAIDADGYQQHIYPEYDFTRLPLRPALDKRGREVVVRIPIGEAKVAAKVWLVQVGRVPLLLLDTDIHENHVADRSITNVLYVRGRETRLLQE